MINILRSWLSLALLLAAVNARSEDSQTLWFEQPATHFTRSLPLGNGRLGAMVFGGVGEERIVLNESSVWSGSPQDADRPEAHRALPEIRKLLLDGKNVEAEALVNANFTCQGPGSGHGSGANVPFGCYQVLGNLHIRWAGAETRRPRIVRAAIHPQPTKQSPWPRTVTQRRNGASFTRENRCSGKLMPARKCA